MVDSDAECQTLLRPEVESFEPAVPNEVPEVKQVERPPNPFVKPAEPPNPFQNTKFAGLSPKAMNWREIGWGGKIRRGGVQMMCWLRFIEQICRSLLDLQVSFLCLEKQKIIATNNKSLPIVTQTQLALNRQARAGSMAFSAAFEEKSEKESQGVAKAGEQSHSTNDQSSLKEKLGQGVSMAAQATRSSVEAARDANRKYGVTEKIGQGISTAANKTVEFEREHQVSSRAMQAARASVSAVRDANQKYGITEKMSQGAVAAYSKARDIEQKHHVTSTVASGIKNGASNVASAASSLGSKVSTKNPFSAGPEVSLAAMAFVAIWKKMYEQFPSNLFVSTLFELYRVLFTPLTRGVFELVSFGIQLVSPTFCPRLQKIPLPMAMDSLSQRIPSKLEALWNLKLCSFVGKSFVTPFVSSF